MISKRSLVAIPFVGAALAVAARWLQSMLAGPLQTTVVVVVIASATGLVYLETKGQADDNALTGPLRPVEFAGRIHDEWQDVFDMPGTPAGLIKNLEGGAEVAARSFMTGAAILDLSVLRADSLAPCVPLADEPQDGRWARSLCPLRLTVFRGERHARQLRGTACFPPRGTPDAATVATFDPIAKVITVSTNIGGHDAPDCQRTFSLAALQQD